MIDARERAVAGDGHHTGAYFQPYTRHYLLFTLVGCFLSAQRRPELDLLVVGAGGGAEIERFLLDNARLRVPGSA